VHKIFAKKLSAVRKKLRKPQETLIVLISTVYTGYRLQYMDCPLYQQSQI